MCIQGVHVNVKETPDTGQLKGGGGRGEGVATWEEKGRKCMEKGERESGKWGCQFHLKQGK